MSATPPLPQSTAPARVNRPGGVTLIVILMWINEIFEIGFGLLIIAFSGNIDTQRTSGFGQSTLIAIGIVGIIIGLISILLANGLAKGSNGARVIVTILIVLQIILDAIELARQALSAASWWNVVGILIWLLVLALLWTSRASQFFKQR